MLYRSSLAPGRRGHAGVSPAGGGAGVPCPRPRRPRGSSIRRPPQAEAQSHPTLRHALHPTHR